MELTPAEEKEIKKQLAACLSVAKEIRKVLIFGSFLNNPNSQDLDVAIFQDSEETYLPLALKYRRLTNTIRLVTVAKRALGLP